MYCSHCGHQNSDDAKFCDNCGKPIIAEQPNQQINEPKDLAPSLLYVPHKGLGAVLGEHEYPAQRGIDAVAEGEIDDAELACKRNSGLSSLLCEGE